MARLNLNQIKSILAAKRADLAERYGVSKIGVFGSYGRNEATEESDIDLLVEFDRPIGLLKFIELEGQLGELLGGKVDLVTQAALKPHIGKRILDEVAMV
ncbi:MAG: nucleotidyltransferase family protein [Candidatus Omnitrophica bacterium]|nr:nucleotidyltransferase family protein [Candidatus Omnitrophota bacterium]MCA9424210.1 nucleotidyltransferase family protein [Candidatus Omnitrophota bacterium]